MDRKGIFAIIIVVISLIGLYFLLNNVFNKKNTENIDYLKNYEVNEYIPTYISDEDMARIYLNDYIHTMYYDVESAYNLLDREYREKRFNSLDNYKNYVDSLNYSTYSLKEYYKLGSDTNTIFGVYDEHDNLYIFKTQGVMQYSVYLDDETVEIR